MLKTFLKLFSDDWDNWYLDNYPYSVDNLKDLAHMAVGALMVLALAVVMITI